MTNILARDSDWQLFYVCYMVNNFKTIFHYKSWKLLAVRAVYECQLHKFNHYVERMVNSTGYTNFLQPIPPEKWCLSYNGGRRYRLTRTNFSEVFNSFLKGDMPFIICVAITLYRVKEYFVFKKDCQSARSKTVSSNIDISQ